MISTPRYAEIRVQGLDDQFRVEVISMDNLIERILSFQFQIVMRSRWIFSGYWVQMMLKIQKQNVDRLLIPIWPLG